MAEYHIEAVHNASLPLTSIHNDQAVRDLGNVVKSLPDGMSGNLSFASNLQLTASLHQQAFHSSGSQFNGMTVGQVIYNHPGSYWYRVQLDIGGGERPCCALGDTAFRAMGVT